MRKYLIAALAAVLSLALVSFAVAQDSTAPEVDATVTPTKALGPAKSLALGLTTAKVPGGLKAIYARSEYYGSAARRVITETPRETIPEER